jgi:hypothetical protein
MVIVKTLEEAKKAVQSQNYNTASYLKFCPILKDMCNVKCVCFSISYYTEKKWHDGPEYTIYEPKCDNAMFAEKEIYYKS